jgi:catechol 2,3-dioxygenase-like lactoylglutathione lyase family enzyme
MESRDPRPLVAIGHVTLRVADVARAAAFYTELGLRLVMESPSLAILELRGGTHLMLFKARRAPKVGRVHSFDLMVDEVETLRTRLAQSGVETTEPADDQVSGHRWFQARDPDGHLLNIYSDHTQGRAV